MTMGDLISREALLEKTKTIYTEADGVLVTASVVTRTDIVMAPAIDAELVRRGKWEMCRATLNTGFSVMTGTYPTCRRIWREQVYTILPELRSEDGG